MKKATATLVFIAALGLLVAACAPAAAPPASEKKEAAPPAKEKPQPGGVYRIITSNPRIGQDPHRTTGSSHFENFGRAYSSLLRFKIAPDASESQLIIASDLAERWENPTPTTWVFHLRKGVKWHNVPPVNGREFVADDVVYSVNRLAGKGSAQAGYWLDLDKVEALDKYTVKFTLKNLVAPFLTIAAYGFNKMVAKEAVEAGGGNLDKGPLIGTGPWLVECTVDVACVYKRNPAFHLKDEHGNQLPYAAEIRGTVMPDFQARVVAFRAKQLDTLGLSVEERAVVERAHPEVIIKEYKLFQHNMIHFRNDRAPWNDERVRTAVSKAVDRQEVIDTIAGGKGWFNMGWLNPAEEWDLPQEEFKQVYKRDVEGAKKLLAEAGHAKGIDASLWCANYGAASVPTCELLAAQMAQASIRIKINVHDVPVYLNRVFKRDGEFEDMAYGPQGIFVDPDLWLSAYYHSQGGRNSGYVNDPQLDNMIEVQRRELDPDKRKKLIQEIERYLLRTKFLLPIYANISISGIWPWVKNLNFSAGGIEYPGYRQVDHVWIDQELKKKLGAPE